MKKGSIREHLGTGWEDTPTRGFLELNLESQVNGEKEELQEH